MAILSMLLVNGTYILWPFGTFLGHLVYFPVLVFCAEENLATLLPNHGFATNDLFENSGS
jgi:hypothetical protein